MTKFYATPNWGSTLHFEVPRADILEERPKPLTVEELLEREIDPPNWAVGVICKLGGRRHEKRHHVFTEHRGSYVPPFGPGGPQPYSPYVNSHDQRGPLSTEDNKAIFEKALMRTNRKKYGAQDRPAARKACPPGNLRNDDYRFWKGFNLMDYMGATCRWCQCTCRTRADMRQHHDNQYCKDHLLALYKYAKQSAPRQRYCFSCKTPTANMHWGLPLCDTVSCLARWKFTNREGWAGFQQYAQWAAEEQIEHPDNGPYTHLVRHDGH